MSPTNRINDNDVWEIIPSFFDQYGLVNHQIEPYNEFLFNGIPSIIRERGKLVVKHNNKEWKVDFKPETIIYQKPVFKETSEKIREDIYPFECMERNITYEGSLFVDIEITNHLGRMNLEEKVLIAKIPVMVKSDLCRLNDITDGLTPSNSNITGEIEEKLASIKEDIFQQGGIFVICGAPKVIACPQRTAFNKTYVFEKKKSVPKFEYFSEIRSSSISGSHSTQIQVGIIKDKISVVLPYIKISTIPLGIIFRALGVESNEEIFSYIVPNEEDEEMIELLLPSLEESFVCDTQDNALNYIGKKGKKFNNGNAVDDDDEFEDRETKEIKKNSIISYARHLLNIKFLPHLGTDENSIINKRYYLGYMVRKLLDVKLGRRSLDDRDHFLNKRAATAGILLTQQFYNGFQKLLSEIENSITTSITTNNFINVTGIISPRTITNVLVGALRDNQWGTTGRMKGISQQYEYYNYISSLSNARKIFTTIAEGGKVDKPRKLHSSQYSIACPFETPEGKTCGLILMLAASTLITVGSEPQPVIEILKTLDITPYEDIPSKERYKYLSRVRVFVNGMTSGVTEKPYEIINFLKELRRRANINPEISIYFDQEYKEIHISTDAGRLIRPALIVENGELVFNKEHLKKIRSGEWDEPSLFINLLENGIVEFLDSAESENILVENYPSNINSNPEITHCELHPSLMLGIGVNLIPFACRNQSPRNTYQASMGKQGIGIPGTNFKFKSKGNTFSLDYPQIPLTTTKIAKIIGYDQMPTGQNVIVFVCPWYGFSQEDSIIINQDFIDRGGMCITAHLPYETTLHIDKNEKLAIPDKQNCGNIKGDFSKLDPKTCIVPKGTKVEKGDVLIGVVLEINNKETIHRKSHINRSIIYNHNFSGTVSKIIRGIDGKGYEYIRVIITQNRPPIFGDKFSAMHGQKGTVGNIYRSIDLPVTEEGVAPDIMINPLALPSRMTIGMLVEMITGKMICSTHAINRMKVKKVFRYDHDDGDPSNGKMDKIKFKCGGYSKMKDDVHATSFQKDFSVEQICAELKKLGINEFGDEPVINGQTGEYMKCMVFSGICYYQRLKHMVIDKVHARSRGGKAALTRQPVEGRRAGGGLKIGRMEADCILANGAVGFARDRLMENSDEFVMWICRFCGIPAMVKSLSGLGKPDEKECLRCQTKNIVQIRIPYATKLMIQELSGMNVECRLLVDPFTEEQPLKK